MAAQKDDFVWVNDRAYDVKSFAKVHPGGATFVSLYGGRDATTAFATYHRRAFPHKSMAAYEIEEKAVSRLYSLKPLP
jgi:fatty acid desaturase (delta-4 desaturase)